MDFFSRQELSRKNTKRLVFYFSLGVLCTIIAVYFIVLAVFEFGSKRHRQFRDDPAATTVSVWNPELFLWASVGTAAVVFFGSLFKIGQLSRGGGVIATELGGTLLNPHATDPDEIKLRNIVEEMALASGIPVPEVYILRQEEGINAFAAGFSTSDAVIGVTRGAIEQLSRDELQGVIAHEFSHILNGDMKLNLRLIGWVHGIVCIALLGQILLRSTRVSSNRKNGNALALFGLGLLLVGGIGAFFGKLIKSAISRQREFLADAAAVQFTRNPQGIAGALKKIGGLALGSELEAPAAEEASHMFFGNGLSKFSWGGMMATHPPLTERIKAIDPQFDGRFSPVPISPRAATRITETVVPTPPRIKNVRPPNLTDLLGGADRMSSKHLVPSTGQPTVAHLHFAGNLLAGLPIELERAAHETFGATALVYAMLLSGNSEAAEHQLAEFRKIAPAAIYRETLRLHPYVQELPAKAKLPVIELTLPALRQLSPAQYDDFENQVKLLIAADREVDLFEFALEKLLLRHLQSQFKPAPKRMVQFYSLRGLADDCVVLLSALAHVGHDDGADVVAAFQVGGSHLKLEGKNLALLPLAQCDLERLDAALNRLAQSAPQCKKLFLEAAAQVVACDGEIQAAEVELLRAMADSLDCPIPPFIQG